MKKTQAVAVLVEAPDSQFTGLHHFELAVAQLTKFTTTNRDPLLEILHADQVTWTDGVLQNMQWCNNKHNKDEQGTSNRLLLSAAELGTSVNSQAQVAERVRGILNDVFQDYPEAHWYIDPVDMSHVNILLRKHGYDFMHMAGPHQSRKPYFHALVQGPTNVRDVARCQAMRQTTQQTPH